MSASSQITITLDQLREIIRTEVTNALQAVRTTKNHVDEECLSPAEAAEILNISSKQVRRLITSDQLKGYRIGKLLKTTRSAVSEYLEACDLSQFN